MTSRSSPSYIPISTVRYDNRIVASVSAVLRSGNVVQGRRVQELELQFSSLVGAEHTVAVNNGTTALIAALQANGVGRGDEVITSPFTFVATLNAILHVGARARFADISLEDFNLQPSNVESLVGPTTKAIMPVHLYGQTADMASISEIASKMQLVLVEDAAQAHLAKQGGRSAGTWGTGCFSLYATKNLTAGEGGLITTNDDSVADWLRVFRNQGMRARYEYEQIGMNCRLTDLQAAVCLPQLDEYQEQIARRQRNAALLNEGLSDLDWICTPRSLPDREHVWHQYTVLVEPDSPITRDELASSLDADGVGCGVYYPRAVFDYEIFRDHPRVMLDDVPLAHDAARRCLSLPVHPHLSESDVARIIEAVRTASRS